MAKVTREQAQIYASRWALVRDAEARELQTTSIGEKFRQLASLVASRDTFGREPDRDEQTREARERWARLRQVLRG